MTSSSRRRLIVSGGSVGLSAIAMLCGIGQLFSAQTQTSIRSTLRIGMANQIPYAYTSETGELIGQSPDVLRAALRDTPYKKLESVVTEFGALIPGLVANRFDIICTGLFIRPQRCDVISFGNVDSMSRTGIMVPKGSPRRIGCFDDIKNMGLRVSFIRGSTEERHVAAAGIPESLWVVLPDVPTVIAAIKGGRADVAVGSAVIFGPTLQKMNEPGVELRTDFAPPEVAGHPAVEYAAMGFRKSDAALREMYNAGLARLVVSGELASINEKWGLPRALTPTAELPPSERLCKSLALI